jgi:hypothetical protein
MRADCAASLVLELPTLNSGRSIFMTPFSNPSEAIPMRLISRTNDYFLSV